jgi:hypothetical protein
LVFGTEILKNTQIIPAGITREYESPSSHGSHVSGTIGAGILDPKAGYGSSSGNMGWNFNTQSNGLPVYAERDCCWNDDIDLTSNSYEFNIRLQYCRYKLVTVGMMM